MVALCMNTMYNAVDASGQAKPTHAMRHLVKQQRCTRESQLTRADQREQMQGHAEMDNVAMTALLKMPRQKEDLLLSDNCQYRVIQARPLDLEQHKFHQHQHKAALRLSCLSHCKPSNLHCRTLHTRQYLGHMKYAHLCASALVSSTNLHGVYQVVIFRGLGFGGVCIGSNASLPC